MRLELPAKIGIGEKILISGAGGGFDVFCGLPLFFTLEQLGKKAFLANLSFSQLKNVKGSRPTPTTLTVTAYTENFSDYFPEKYLCEWFRSEGRLGVQIHCFEITGVQPLLAGYRKLVEDLGIDTLILVDGGTDSLMIGNEDGLGTPEEDVVSILAANELDVPNKVLGCLGLGVDHFHGVSNFFTLGAIADLVKAGAFLGAAPLIKGTPAESGFRNAARFVFERMPRSESIVLSSILSSVDGEYGDFHSTPRTRGSRLWINPLMSFYWFFDLAGVARRILYPKELVGTVTRAEVVNMIDSFRKRISPDFRKRQPIPD